MKIAQIIVAASLSLAFTGSASLAQQPLAGTVVKIDRINGTLGIRPTQNGTTGANTGGAAEEFKAQGGLSLDNLHAGDRVTFSATGAGGARTITKIDKQ
jgi:hypothetical protein